MSHGGDIAIDIWGGEGGMGWITWEYFRGHMGTLPGVT